MPWFCKSSRKRSKVKVGSVTISKDDGVIHGGTKPLFGVVLQDFPASAQDELTVQRGQVIELLYTDGSWQYVRNVDGKCGYMPNSFCYLLEQMKWMQDKEIPKSPKIKPRPRTLHLDEILTQSAGQTPTDENVSLRSTHPTQAEGDHQTTPPGSSMPLEGATPAEAERMRHGGSNRHGQIPPETNVSASRTDNQLPRAEEQRTAAVPTSTAITSSPPKDTAEADNLPTAEESITLPTPSKGIPQPIALSTPKPKAHPEQDANCPSSRKSSSAAKRTLLYQEPAREEEPAHPLAVQESHYDRLESYPSDTSLPDDVFLPDLKKPVGIFQSTEAYRARFQGEISLEDKELVIVLELGRGEWAWVITSVNMEGLVPKKILMRYKPGSRGAAAAVHSTVATQTELVITPALRQLSTSSAGAGNCSNGSVNSKSPVQDGASPLEEDRIETNSIGVQTECTTPDWFKHNASPRHEEGLLQLPKPTPRTGCLNSSLPASPTPSSPMPISKARYCSENALEHSQLLQRHKRLAKSEPRCNIATSSSYSPLTRKLKPQTPILTAVKDYVPPMNAKNCLSLKKGDILYQQAHVPYPNGWMWVYHSMHRSYGYVPKNHMAYMYAVPRKPRQCGPGTLLEDEV